MDKFERLNCIDTLHITVQRLNGDNYDNGKLLDIKNENTYML